MKNSFLIGERIYLRALDENDLNGNYINWFNDEEVCSFNSHHIFPYTKKMAEDYVKNSREFKNLLALAVVLKNEGRHIGNISLQNINYFNRSAEFAVVLGEKDCWGKGYSKESSHLLIKHGFMSLNLNRIYCGTSEKNKAMQKLAFYLGMKEEGLRRLAFFKDGKFVNIIEYGLLKDEFLDKFNLE